MRPSPVDVRVRPLPRGRRPLPPRLRLAAELERLLDREASLMTVCAEAPVQLGRIRARISVLQEELEDQS